MNGVIEGAAAAGARLVYGDNLYMYGPVKGPIREDLPYRPVGPNAGVRAEVATTFLNAHATGRVGAAIGRARPGPRTPWPARGAAGARARCG